MTVATVPALAASLLASCGAQAHTGAVTTTTTTSRPTTSTTAAAAAQPYTWQRDQGMTLELGGGPSATLSAVVAPGPGGNWLVAGSQLTPSGSTLATVWTSPNSANWSKTTLATPAGTSSAAALAASYWGGRTVVVGSAGTGPTMRAAVWVAGGPGRPLSLVPDAPALDPPSPGQAAGAQASNGQSGAVMDTVAAGALGVFAAGTVDGNATVWYSTDGQHWSVLSGADSTIDHDPGAVINDLLITPNGVFAAGSSVNSDRLSAALWYSSDGIHWTTVRSAVSTFFGNGDHVITSLVDIAETGNPVPGTPGPTGLLAVGGVRIGASWQPASWISPNGFSWSQTSESFPLDREPPESPGAIAYAATGADGRLWAVGGSPRRQRAWVSSRGEAWSEVALPPAAAGDTSWHLGLVATSGTTTVMADNLPGQPYVLVRKDGAWSEPSAGGVFGSPLTTAVPTSLVSDNGYLVMSVQLTDPGQALGGGTSSVAVLTSPDGQTWQTSNVDAFDDASVSQLLPVQGGLLAVGSARARPPAGEGRGAFASLSNDLGVTWPGTGINPGSLGDGSQGAVAAGRLGQSEYVVGRQGARAVEWYSPTGTRWQEPQPLDPSPQLGVEQPLAACSGPDSAVVVGSVTGTARGSLPAAWVSGDGLNWLNATITPSQPAGASSSIEGCLFTGNSFIAYGGTTGRGQAEQPAIWSSPDGSVWQRQPSNFAGLDGHGPVGLQAAPLDQIAYGGTTWVGVSGAGDLPSEQWPTPVGGSASATPVAAGLWDSTDAGSNWQQLGTGAAPFAGVLYAQADQATYVGQQPVVAGFVDGQLAVWVGTPTAAGGS